MAEQGDTGRQHDGAESSPGQKPEYDPGIDPALGSSAAGRTVTERDEQLAPTENEER